MLSEWSKLPKRPPFAQFEHSLVNQLINSRHEIKDVDGLNDNKAKMKKASKLNWIESKANMPAPMPVLIAAFQTSHFE